MPEFSDERHVVVHRLDTFVQLSCYRDRVVLGQVFVLLVACGCAQLCEQLLAVIQEVVDFPLHLHRIQLVEACCHPSMIMVAPRRRLVPQMHARLERFEIVREQRPQLLWIHIAQNGPVLTAKLVHPFDVDHVLLHIFNR